MHADGIGAHRNIATADTADLALADGAHTGGGGFVGVGGRMFAGDDQPAFVVVIQIGVEFRDDLHRAGPCFCL